MSESPFLTKLQVSAKIFLFSGRAEKHADKENIFSVLLRLSLFSPRYMALKIKTKPKNTYQNI